MTIVDIIKMIFPLLLLMSLLGIVLWYVKKMSFNKGPKGVSPINIKVISNKALMPKKYVSVIKIKDKYLVLGLSDSNIVLLKEFDAPEEDEVAFENSIKENFLEIFKRNLFNK